MSTTSALFAIVEDAFVRWRTHRQNARTRRIVSGLPRQIRKDIGWPEAIPDRRDSRWL